MALETDYGEGPGVRGETGEGKGTGSSRKGEETERGRRGTKQVEIVEMNVKNGTKRRCKNVKLSVSSGSKEDMMNNWLWHAMS